MAKKAEIPDQSDVLAVEEWGDQFVFRPVGKVFVSIILGTPITPNQITFARVGIAIFAMVLLAIGTPIHLVAAAICIFLGGILDATDGQLARARGTSNPAGLVLDDAADTISFIAVNIGMFLNLVNRDFGDGNEVALFLLMAISASLGGVYFSQIDYQVDRAGKLTGTKNPRLHSREEFARRLLEATSIVERSVLLGYQHYCRVQDYFAGGKQNDETPAWPAHCREAQVARALLEPLLHQWMVACISAFWLAATLAAIAAALMPEAFFYFFCIVAPATAAYLALMVIRTKRVDQMMRSEGILPSSDGQLS